MHGIRKGLMVAAAAAAVAMAGAAHATNLLTDNFDTEAGGGTQLNYTGYANWNVTSGTVDQIHQGGFGLSCVGGAGGCVDLDGSTFQSGTMTTKTAFSFNAGDRVTFSAQISGDQRGGSDVFAMGFTFGGVTNIASYDLGGFWGPVHVFNAFSSTGVQTSTGVSSADPYRLFSISFLAGQAGTFNAYVSTFGNDNVGPMLDDVSIDRTGRGVPEPATWAVMLTGFAGLGGALRRRRSLAAA